MRIYDAFERLAMSPAADIVAVILADSNINDVEFVPVRPLTLPDGELDALAASGRGLQFLGVVALVGRREVRDVMAVSLDETRKAALAAGFAHYCQVMLGADRFREIAMGDSLAWLEQLYKLEDPRPN